MRTRGNQLLIQILLMIIITVIVAYTCMNLAELVNMYSEAIGKAITQINAGFRLRCNSSYSGLLKAVK